MKWPEPEHGIYLDPKTTQAVEELVLAMENEITREHERNNGEYLSAYGRGQVLSEQLPDWAKLLRSAMHQQRAGHGEETCAGSIPLREIELFGQLRRAIILSSGGLEKARHEFQKLVTYVPESLPAEVAVDMATDGTLEAQRQGLIPFVSEAFLYPLLGKEDARSVLCHLRDVAVALGAKDLDEIQEPVLRERRTGIEERAARRAERAKKKPTARKKSSRSRASGR